MEKKCFNHIKYHIVKINHNDFDKKKDQLYSLGYKLINIIELAGIRKGVRGSEHIAMDSYYVFQKEIPISKGDIFITWQNNIQYTVKEIVFNDLDVEIHTTTGHMCYLESIHKIIRTRFIEINMPNYC